VNMTNVLWEPNGSYSYTIEPVAGYETTWTGNVNVTGAAVVVNVSFVQIVYPVTFHETGLANGTFWQAGIGGSTNSSRTSNVTVWEPNGSYLFQIPSVVGYAVGLSSGPLTVNGTGPTVPVTFSPLYAVTFVETGLPRPGNWSVTVSGRATNSTAYALSISEPNGSYSYTVSTTQVGYRANVTHGTFQVNGSAVNLTVAFATNASLAAKYPVEFQSSGFPGGSVWSVSFNNETPLTMGPNLTFEVPNGTYSFAVTAPGYTVTPSTGTILVDGPGSYADPIVLQFSAIQTAPPPENYSVLFAETGLAFDAPWSVKVNGTTMHSSSTTVDFLETNGTYSYEIGPVPGFATTWSGRFTVAGTHQTVGIAFHVFLYEVQFAESGLASGTTWNVSLADATNASSGNVITFARSNGTYAYSFLPVAGYDVPGPGSLVINGSAPPVVDVSFRATSTSGATLFGLPIVAAALLLAAVVIAVLAIAVVLLRRRPSSPSPTTPAADESSVPDDADLEP
jgi:hypothetical protein